MTALPVKEAIPPAQALVFVKEVRERCTVVTLTDKEYYDCIEKAAFAGFKSGRVYDALLLKAATKIEAEIIYTWNIKHFRSIDLALARRIRTP